MPTRGGAAAPSGRTATSPYRTPLPRAVAGIDPATPRVAIALRPLVDALLLEWTDTRAPLVSEAPGRLDVVAALPRPARDLLLAADTWWRVAESATELPAARDDGDELLVIAAAALAQADAPDARAWRVLGAGGQLLDDADPVAFVLVSLRLHAALDRALDVVTVGTVETEAGGTRTLPRAVQLPREASLRLVAPLPERPPPSRAKRRSRPLLRMSDTYATWAQIVAIIAAAALVVPLLFALLLRLLR